MGKVLTAVIAMLGIGMVAVPTGILGAAFAAESGGLVQGTEEGGSSGDS